MLLVRLIYASTISEQFSPDDIEIILETSRKNNKANNLTGMLCFNRKYFLQCIEGTRGEVNKVYHRISGDDRHRNITLLQYQEIVERDFSEWSMAFVPESKLTEKVNLTHSGSDRFLPHELSGASAHGLMQTLRDTLS